MPFAFLLVGSAFLIAGVRGKDTEFLTLLKGDFTGSPNFISWMVAILAIGALGYIESIRPIARAFLVLVIVALFLSNGGFFTKFMQQINYHPNPSPNSPNTQPTSTTPLSPINTTITGLTGLTQ